MSVPQAQAVVADVAAITQALVMLDQRYRNTPGWEQLAQGSRLGWAALAQPGSLAAAADATPSSTNSGDCMWPRRTPDQATRPRAGRWRDSSRP